MTDLDEKYRAEGWGKITDAALGIAPSAVESQARGVARYAAQRIAVLEQACGAAAVAMMIDMDGGQIAACAHNSPFMMVCRAVGLDPVNAPERAIEIVAAIRAKGPLVAAHPANPAQVTDAVKAASDAVWNGFLYGIDSITWNGAFARAPSLDDADKIARLVIAAIGAGGQAVADSPDALIERMVLRFLQWKLPENFNPDGGIQFVKHTDYGHTFEPVGTNLFDYMQAKAMVRHMLEGVPDVGTVEPSAARPLHWIDVLREWFGGERYARDYEYLDANYSDHARRVAMYAATLSQPHPADERVVEALAEILSLEDKGASAHGKWGDAYRIARAALSGSGAGATHRHKKRGSEYVLLGVGRMQAQSWIDEGRMMAPVDCREVTIYRSVDDGSLWARPREEFEDGRFEVLVPGATL